MFLYTWGAGKAGGEGRKWGICISAYIENFMIDEFYWKSLNKVLSPIVSEKEE